MHQPACAIAREPWPLRHWARRARYACNVLFSETRQGCENSRRNSTAIRVCRAHVPELAAISVFVYWQNCQ